MSRISFLLIPLFIGEIYLFTAVQIGSPKTENRNNGFNPHAVIASDTYTPGDSLLPETVKRGKNVYMANCLSCHMTNGEGIQGAFPPLAKSDYLMADSIRAIRVALYGQSDTITVNGVKFFSPSPALSHLTDQQMADVMNYIRNSWGNRGGMITPELVASQRKQE